jgi:hypothetical protein
MRYTYTVSQYHETLRVFDTYREAAHYLRELEPDDSRWELHEYAINEVREEEETE